MKTYKKVDLHPATIKHISNGHFWVTEDSFTKRFPRNETFLIGVDSKTKKEFGLFLNDPTHKNVKARLFSKNVQVDINTEIAIRIDTALKKRVDHKLLDERENILLVNGESDLLPGLMILILKDQIMIQYYALYWKNFEEQIIKELKRCLEIYFPDIKIKEYWIQERNFDQQKSIRSLNNSEFPEFVLAEFNIKYHIKINAYYDYGIYTDMSSIRKQILPYMKGKMSALNLFCYTGAYSLFALKHKMESVTSVDLSEKYLKWLDDNIALNTDLDNRHHSSICMSVEKALDKFIAEKKQFEFIFSDPPSSSSDGETRTNAFNSYESTLPKMLQLLARSGSLVVFLNTHQISWNKFEDKLKSIINSTDFKDQVIIGKRFKLAEDYLPTKGFHEGDYLKGFLIEFKNKDVK